MSVLTVGPVLVAQSKDDATDVSKTYRTRSGKTFIVSQTHPAGRSLAMVEVRTEGFEHNFGEVFEDRDPISDVFVADLDGNGFDEIYIVTTAVGPGSYGSVLGFASNNNNRQRRELLFEAMMLYLSEDLNAIGQTSAQE
jgi:hypothetical protein